MAPRRSALFRRKSVAHILRQLREDQAGMDYHGLSRNLGVRDLVMLGIAAIIGAGIFSTVGEAAYNGGPAISVLFIFTALACGFAALCYAEFASALPIAGSAYTYAYASFGELIAWIIGWDLLIEYAIGNITVAISWSDYLSGFLRGLGVDLPAWMTTDYLTAARLHTRVSELLSSAGQEMQSAVAAFKADPSVQILEKIAGGKHLKTGLAESWQAWETAPSLGGLRVIADLPALFIVAAITLIVYVGIRESKRTSNLLVGIKLAVIALVVLVGVFYIEPDNWSPFAPNGFGGVMSGVAAVFFAYIGFDALSTTAEETKNPQRDLPKAMIYTLAICTVLYIIIALVLTGMVHYSELSVGDPMAFAIRRIDLPGQWSNLLSGLVALGAIIATTSVLLVFQMGQPRILMSMSRDGLLPKRFAKIHPRFRTPSFATVITGFMVAIPALFMNISEVTDLTSIGTLFAFVLVCGGVLIQQKTAGPDYQPQFRVYFINGRYLLPGLVAGILVALALWSPEQYAHFFTVPEGMTLWGHVAEELPLGIFWIVAVGLSWLSFRQGLSLIPALGLLICLYLMAQVEAVSWYRFLGWLLLGLGVYFLYSRHHSRLDADEAADRQAREGGGS